MAEATPEFPAALRAAMDAAGLNITRTASTSGLNAQTVSCLLRGVTRPTPQSAVKLANALDAPRLIAIVERPRRRHCEVCQQRFTTIHNSPTRRRFCSSKCQQRAWARKRYGGKSTERVNGFRLREMQAAVEKFCGRCVGEDRYCPDARCELRQFSPMPLIPLGRRVA